MERGDETGRRLASGRRRRIAAAAGLFAAPAYLAPTGPFALVMLPALGYMLGPRVWPGRTPRRSLTLAVLVAGALLAASLLVYPYTRRCGPVGFLADVVAPVVALSVYAGGCILALRRPRAWPLSVIVAALSLDAVAQIAQWTGAEAAC
jgi:hypothetical protein